MAKTIMTRLFRSSLIQEGLKCMRPRSGGQLYQCQFIYFDSFSSYVRLVSSIYFQYSDYLSSILKCYYFNTYVLLIYYLIIYSYFRFISISNMFRAIPTNNKICFDKDLKRSWKIHEQKLKRIKGSVGKEKPQQFIFLDQRPKKAALAEVRNIEIQKQNNVLLTKIKTIGQKGCKTSYTKSSEKLNSGNKRTLNQPYRKRNLVKIVQENQQLMKRLQSKKSMYNTKKWEKQRKDIEKNITLISSYPYKNYPSTQTQLWMTEQNFSNRKEDERSVHNSRFRLASLNYEGTKKINDSYYLVTSYTSKKTFFIEIQNLEDVNEKYRMQMQERQVHKLLQQIFDNSLDKLFNSLQIEHQKGCFLKYEMDEMKLRPNSMSKSPKKLQ